MKIIEIYDTWENKLTRIEYIPSDSYEVSVKHEMEYLTTRNFMKKVQNTRMGLDNLLPDKLNYILSRFKKKDV